MADEPEQIERGWRAPFGFWAGPILWGLQILAGYGLASVSCNAGSRLPVLLMSGISGVVVLAAAVVAYGAWRDWRDNGQPMMADANQPEHTSAFLAVSGFVVSLLFFLLILATFISDIFLSACPIITMPLP